MEIPIKSKYSASKREGENGVARIEPSLQNAENGPKPLDYTWFSSHLRDCIYYTVLINEARERDAFIKNETSKSTKPLKHQRENNGEKGIKSILIESPILTQSSSNR